MKVTFSSQKDKDNALTVARSSAPELCGQMYLYMIEGGEIDESLVTSKVEEESLVDDSVEQIKL